MQLQFKIVSALFGLLSLLASTNVNGALPGESIVLDPHTGDYTITYWDYPRSPKKQLRQAIFVPATKIDPAVKSTLKLAEDSVVVYAYRIANGSRSRQSLVAVRLDPVSDIVSSLPLPKGNQDVDPNMMEQVIAAGMAALTTPYGWNGGSYASHESGLRISWSHSNLRSLSDGLPPGNIQDGFGFSSRDIPGIGVAQLSGHSPVPMYPGEGPTGTLGKEFEAIEQKDFVPRSVAVPTIAVPVPFDAAVLIERIRTHVATWPSKQLLDSAYAEQLDRYLVAATEAYRLNNTKAGKEHIVTLRKMLAKEHHHVDHDDDDGEERRFATRFSIDRLAARVLDFDLRYVLKRMEHEHNEGERKKERD